MNYPDIIALLPLIITGVTAVLVLIEIGAFRNHRATVVLTLIGLALAFAALAVSWPLAPRQVTPLLRIDRFAVFYIGLLLAAAFAVVMLSARYWDRRGGRREESYPLLLLAVLGAGILVANTHFASFFLGLELLSVSLYALIAYQYTRVQSVEAGIKYLVLAGMSSAFLLFGMALAYAATGTMSLAGLLAGATNPAVPALPFYGGLGLIIAGISFKLALVPFHFWTPDIYQGAPAPITAFIATVSKGAIFALLLRYFIPLGVLHVTPLYLIFVILSILSMFIGNLLALRERNLKRLLAYSSIAHMGYLLVAFLAGGQLAVTAVTFYLLAYFITTLGAFGVVSELSGREEDAELLDDYRGLAWRHPWMAGVLTASLFSLAGIPLTVGFFGKFYLLAAGVDARLWFLVILLVISSAIGLVYYLRVVFALYGSPEDPLATGLVITPAHRPAFPYLGGIVLAALAALLLWLGLYPAPAIRVIEIIARSLF